MSRLMIAARPYADDALPTPAFASPEPTILASVSTFTTTESNDAIRPKSLVCCRSGGIGTCTHVPTTLVIFIVRLLVRSPRVLAAPTDHRTRGRRRAPVESEAMTSDPSVTSSVSTSEANGAVVPAPGAPNSPSYARDDLLAAGPPPPPRPPPGRRGARARRPPSPPRRPGRHVAPDRPASLTP